MAEKSFTEPDAVGSLEEHCEAAACSLQSRSRAETSASAGVVKFMGEERDGKVAGGEEEVEIVHLGEDVARRGALGLEGFQFLVEVAVQQEGAVAPTVPPQLVQFPP
jgi:hypothetical protein